MRIAILVLALAVLGGCATVGDTVREVTRNEVNPVGLYVAFTHDSGESKGTVLEGRDVEYLKSHGDSNGVEVGVTFSLESKAK